jgi:hypothetical protein
VGPTPLINPDPATPEAAHCVPILVLNPFTEILAVPGTTVVQVGEFDQVAKALVPVAKIVTAVAAGIIIKLLAAVESFEFAIYNTDATDPADVWAGNKDIKKDDGKLVEKLEAYRFVTAVPEGGLYIKSI